MVSMAQLNKLFRKYKMRIFIKVLLALFIIVMPAMAQQVSLPNSDFTRQLDQWSTRTHTKRVYRIISRPNSTKKYFQFEIRNSDPARDRAGVYIQRRDLPVSEGYYHLQYRAKSALKSGRGGARIIIYNDKGLTASYAPGRSGNPLFTGTRDWTDYQFTYHVPAGTTSGILQFEINKGIGTVSLDKIQLTRVDEAEGKKLMAAQQAASAQKKEIVIPPFKHVPDRTRQYPLKTQSMIFTDADIKIARQNIAKYPQAKAVEDAILEKANPWLQWSDSDLRDLMTSPEVPRDAGVNANGCPIHGSAVFAKGGFYPWILDPHHPFQVECPIGHEKYPSNDYLDYYKSTFKVKKGWDTKYVDDGWGWVAPDGKRYTFVAYANHWMWRDYIMPAIRDLGRAYLLTGDKRYAHKAAVMLYRLAEVYPSMDYQNQSHFALSRKAAGGIYLGKVFNWIWETDFSQYYSECYDAVWNTIDGDMALQQFYYKDGTHIRSFIEANLLEEAIDAYFKDQIRGNYGTHQRSLIDILLARQNADTQKYFSQLVNDPGEDRPHSGLRYTLYNQIWRDGNPLESPGYNWGGFTYSYAILSEMLQRGGYNLYDDPKLKLLFDWPLNILTIGKYTPDIGDSGSTLGGTKGHAGGNTYNVYRAAYAAYKSPRYLEWLASAHLTGPDGIRNFDGLFKPLLPETKSNENERALPPQPSRLFAGFGLGILNNPKDTNALALTYNMHVSHYHWDFLNFGFFANGQKMMPDLGYPDAMNGTVKEIYTWSKNTISHNTVVVDKQKQTRNAPGVMHDFADAPFARSIDASSPAYSQTSEYRRNMIMVDTENGQSYTVDFFRVNGGKTHDYSLHGPPGTVQTLDGNWSEPAKGTFAGADVQWGKIYDDPVLGKDSYNGSYSGYRGSGYQYLYNVQQLQNGESLLQYQHLNDANAKLRIHLLPQENQKVYMADAYDLPRKKSHVLKYLIARRESTDNKPLQSTFISVLETYAQNPFIARAEKVALDKGDGDAVKITRKNFTDIVLSSTNSAPKVLLAYHLETDAQHAVVTFDKSGKLTRVFFSAGSYFQIGDKKLTASPISGVVTAVSPMQQTVNIQWDGNGSLDAARLTNSIVYFSNAESSRAHPIASADVKANQLTLKTQDALLVGRVKIIGSANDTFTTDTALPFSPTYTGATLLNDAFQQVGTLKSVGNGSLHLAGTRKHGLDVNDNAWISDVGIGDKVTIHPMCFYEAK